MSAGIAKDPWKVSRLVVWDVNDTIVIGSIDEAVMSLLPAEQRQALTLAHKSQSWDNATLMTNAMRTLKEFRIGRWAIQSLIRNLPLHRLMVDAVREMHRERVVQVIISHSNVPFIHTLLEHYGILDHFSVIFANEGEWYSSECDSPMEVRPMHKSLKHEGHTCGCNWQQTGICRRVALDCIKHYLHLEPWIALMHANWGLCALNCLKNSFMDDILLHRIGSKPNRSKMEGTGTDQTLDTDISRFNVIKYQHGEDLINNLRQPPANDSRTTAGMLQSGRRESSTSFLNNAAHYFDDTRLCSTPDRRMCRKYPN